MAEVTCAGRTAEAQRGAERAAASRSDARFDAALERASREGAAGRAGPGDAAGCPGPAGRPPQSTRATRRAAQPGRCQVGEAEGSAPGPSLPGGSASAGPLRPSPDDAQAVQELRAAVRALPAAVAAHPAGSLALSLGSALTVDLRAGVQGLELTLHPAKALERAARAELPGLVEALRARGLRVARADVRSRSGGAAGPRAR